MGNIVQEYNVPEYIHDELNRDLTEAERKEAAEATRINDLINAVDRSSLITSLGHFPGKESFYNGHWFDVMRYPSGVLFGNAYQKYIISVFTGLKKALGVQYDADLGKLRVEIKAIRVMDDTGRYLPGDYYGRALSKEESHNSSRAWLQIKPDHFDLFLGFVDYKDQTDFYLIPSCKICRGVCDVDSDKIKLGKQHDTTDKDKFGQLSPFNTKVAPFFICSATADNSFKDVNLLSIIRSKNYDRV